MFESSLLVAVLLAAAAAEVPDPTRPPDSVGAAVGDAPRAQRWLLQSTVIGPKHRHAVINGENLRVGDVIDGARIKAIEAGRVRLIGPDGSIELTLTFQSIHKASTP